MVLPAWKDEGRRNPLGSSGDESLSESEPPDESWVLRLLAVVRQSYFNPAMNSETFLISSAVSLLANSGMPDPGLCDLGFLT